MAESFVIGDCVRIPDGRIGRVREIAGGRYKVRVQRETSQAHQFVEFAAGDLERVDCPKGWMSQEGARRRHGERITHASLGHGPSVSC